jgi:5-methylcytosine-specific restriction endonuclease McrA
MRPRIKPARFRTSVGPPKLKLVSKVRRTQVQAYTVNWDAISAAVIRRDGGRCTECGSTKQLNAHHIIPVARGGLTVLWNLKTLCRLCHSRKPGHSHL